ncbi:MAG: BatD family protein [Candidatus Poribacteria bacterium]|nr:BatD family protein [Candidatus Poribacteria bacterium]
MRIGYGKNYFNNSAKAAPDVRGIGRLQKDGKMEGGKQGSRGWKDGAPPFHSSTLPTKSLPIFFLGIVFILLAAKAQGQGVNVAAVINPRQIQIGEKARLDLTLSGDTAITHIEAPKFNFLPAFLAVPLHSKTTPRLASNKIAVSMAWAYELIPQATGDFSLSDVRFAYQGNTYFANPGSIRVSSADTYTDVSTRSVHQVEAEVSTTEPYLNAPLTYTFRYLYTAVLPTQASPTPQLPIFPDFLVEELPPLSPQTQRIRGKTFWVQEQVRRLYPQRTGQIVIAPATLLLPVPRGRKTLKTDPLKLTVQPLPETGKPSQFSGAVGEYQIAAQVDRRSIEAGRALTLSLQISGRGSMQTVTAPKVPAVPGVVVNGPTRVEDSVPTTRTYAYALIPARSGTLRIPAIAYIYFDPSRAVYATAQTSPIPVSVRPNPTDAVGDDTAESSLWWIWVILFAVLLLGILVAGFLWYRTRFQRATGTPIDTTTGTGSVNNVEPKGRTGRQAETEGTPPVSQARDALMALARNDTTDAAMAFANALAQILYQYLEATLGLTQRTIDTVREVCIQAGVSEQILEELVDLLTKCDYHRFAPVPLTANEGSTLITRTEAVISNIENLLITDNR